MDFLNAAVSYPPNWFIQYQWIIGILLTAGLTMLLYFRLLRINNFLHYFEKFQINMKSFLFIDTIEYRDNDLFFKETGEAVEERDATDLALWFNLMSQVGMLLEKGLIDEDLTYKHFANNVFGLCTRHAEITDYLQNRTGSYNINYLFRRFSKLYKRGKRMQKIKMLFGFDPSLR